MPDQFPGDGTVEKSAGITPRDGVYKHGRFIGGVIGVHGPGESAVNGVD